ncbi:hypothetical protein OF001_U220049 [Pseudomonas sp. OF001]|nr:hypothetical protein OF001_U220049 [Pseudomonas sp. OF001]
MELRQQNHSYHSLFKLLKKALENIQMNQHNPRQRKQQRPERCHNHNQSRANIVPSSYRIWHDMSTVINITSYGGKKSANSENQKDTSKHGYYLKKNKSHQPDVKQRANLVRYPIHQISSCTKLTCML